MWAFTFKLTKTEIPIEMLSARKLFSKVRETSQELNLKKKEDSPKIR